MTRKILYKNDFSKALDSTWEIIRDVPEAYHVAEHALHIRTLPGTLWKDANDAHNIMLRPEMAIEDGLSSQVTVTNTPKMQGEQGGMIWYIDDDCYVKLIKENLAGSEWIVMAREVNGEAVLVDKAAFDAPTACIRLRLNGEQVIGEVQSGTDKWTQVGVCEPLPSNTMKPGIYSHGGPAETEHWAKLEAYKIFIG